MATPPCCPTCDSFLIIYCPQCWFPIIATVIPKDSCALCNCDLRRNFARSIYPRRLSHEQLTRMISADWMTPAIRRSDGSFYLALAGLTPWWRKNDVASNSLAAFWYVRVSNPEDIESVTVRLTRQPHYFAVLENQLRRVADLLAIRLTERASLMGEYEFDGEHFVEIQWPAISLE